MDEPSMALDAPRDEPTTIEEEHPVIQSRLRPLPMQAPSDIPEANDSLNVEFPDSNESINIRNQIPALRYDPSTSTLSLGNNPDTSIIQEYEEDITNNNQNTSLIDLLQNEESLINSTLNFELDQHEFADLMDKQERLIEIIGQCHFTSAYSEKLFKRTQETIINVFQNPEDYKLDHAAGISIYRNFLDDMLSIMHPQNGAIIIQNRDRLTLELKWYYIAILLRSNMLTDTDAMYIPVLTFKSTQEVLQWITNHHYDQIIQDTIYKQFRDETARRRREARHIYFRNLNARQNRIQSRIRRRR